MSSDESDILLTEANGLLYNDTYKVSQVFIRCCGGPLYLRQRICELTKVPDASPEVDEIAACAGKSNAAKAQKLLIKSSRSGTVRNIFVKKDQVVTIGSKVVRVSVCRHPTMLGNTCGDCGVTIEEEDEEEGIDTAGEGSGRLGLHQQQETVAMLHSMPGLKVSLQEAKRLGREDKQHLLDNHKLVLLVDLDQTILHTTNDEPPPNAEDLFHFRLHQLGPVYHTRLRPYTRQFLKTVSRQYQLHICTFGVREYAHAIARHLDPDGELFGDRILSRNECLDPMSKKANLKSLFPCGDELVCIMDDRSDVWNFAPNVVQVLPCLFFEQTGDINAPPTALPELNRASGAAPDLSDSVLNKARRKHPDKLGRSQQEGGAKLPPNLQQPTKEATVQQQQRKMILQQQAAFNSGKILSCSREQQERLQKAVSSLQGSDSNSSSTAYSDVDEVAVNGEEEAVETVTTEVDKGDKSITEPVSNLAKRKSEDSVDSEKVSKGGSDQEPSKVALSGVNKEVLAKDKSAGESEDFTMATDDVTDQSMKEETVYNQMSENELDKDTVSKDIGSSDGSKQNSDGVVADVEKPTSSDSPVDEEATENANNIDGGSTVPAESDEKTTEKNTEESSVTKSTEDSEGHALAKDLTETKLRIADTLEAEADEKTKVKDIEESSAVKPKDNLDQDFSEDLTKTKPSKGPTSLLDAEKVEKSDDIESRKSVSPRQEEKLKNGTLFGEQPTKDVAKIVDSDDYLLHLEDILKKIHGEFYSQYKPTKPPAQRKNLAEKSKSIGSDDNEPQRIGPFKLPDLKEIVPELRSEVLVGCSIVFSGVVPRGTDLLNSKAYGLATSLGARVCEDLTLPPKEGRSSTAKDGTSLFGQSDVPTTHVVAANLNTAKVKTAKSTRAALKSIQVVTPDWLWTCWERWERVDERLYPLTAETEATLRRSPPHHYCAPPPGMFRQQNMDLFLMGDTAKKSMMEEVAEQCDSDDSAGGSDASLGKGPADKARGLKRPLDAVNPDSSQTSSSGNDDVEDDSESNSKDATFKTRPSQPEKKRKKLMRKKRKKKKLDRQFVRNPRRSDGVCGGDDDTDEDDSSETDELPSVRFRRGGALESGGEESSSAASDVEALDSGEEERLLRLEQDLMES